MTGADLSATSKPWDLQMVTVKTIYEEFYNQGDTELMAGRQPVPIMNRIYIDQQALHQVCSLKSPLSVTCMKYRGSLLNAHFGTVENSR